MAAGVAILLGAVASSALAQGPTDSPQPAEATPTGTKPQADIPFPTTLAGVPLDVQTYTGPEWLDASFTRAFGDDRAAEGDCGTGRSARRLLDAAATRTAAAARSTHTRRIDPPTNLCRHAGTAKAEAPRTRALASAKGAEL